MSFLESTLLSPFETVGSIVSSVVSSGSSSSASTSNTSTNGSNLKVANVSATYDPATTSDASRGTIQVSSTPPAGYSVPSTGTGNSLASFDAGVLTSVKNFFGFSSSSGETTSQDATVSDSQNTYNPNTPVIILGFVVLFFLLKNE